MIGTAERPRDDDYSDLNTLAIAAVRNALAGHDLSPEWEAVAVAEGAELLIAAGAFEAFPGVLALPPNAPFTRQILRMRAEAAERWWER